MSYNYYNGSYNYDGLFGALAGMLVFISIVSLAAAVFSIIVMWKIFKKAGKEGWIAIIPIYNVYTLFEITWGNGWYFLLIFTSIIPFLGWIACIVIMVMTMIKLAKAFGKDGGFAVGLIFLSIIFMAILAFDKSTYLGVPASGSNMTPAGPPVPPQDSFQNAGPVPTPQNDITGSMVSEPIIDNGMDKPAPDFEPASAPTENTSFCTNCGASLPEGTVFCPNCGSPKAS